MQSEPKPKVWPFNGYAPGNYYCKCLSCREEFIGDKRAFACLECAVIASRSILSPISADAVVEACAKVADDLAKEWEGDAELWHKDGMLKTAAISLLHSEAARKVAAPIRALKGTFPAAPEAKSEVAVKALDEEKTQGWMADDGRFCLPMSFGYFIKFPKDDDKTQTFMAWHYHEPVGGSSSIKTVRELAQEHHRRRIRSALVDPECGV